MDKTEISVCEVGRDVTRVDDFQFEGESNVMMDSIDGDVHNGSRSGEEWVDIDGDVEDFCEVVNMDKTEISEVGRDVNRADDFQGENGASPEMTDSDDVDSDDVDSDSSSFEDGEDVRRHLEDSCEIAKSLTREEFASGYRRNRYLLLDLFLLSSKPYSAKLDKAGLPEALSSVLHLLDGTGHASQIHYIIDCYGFLLFQPYPRSSVLHAVLNFKGLDKNTIFSKFVPHRENFLCTLLRHIRDATCPRLSFEQSRMFALHVETAGPPLHYGSPLHYRPPLSYGPSVRYRPPLHYGPSLPCQLRLPNGSAIYFRPPPLRGLPLGYEGYISPEDMTLFDDACLAITCPWTQHQPIFKTAVELNLIDEALLLYHTGAVCYKELHEIHEEEESKGLESMLNQHPQTRTAQFLESVIHTPRSLFLTCTLEVASLIQRKPEGAEALRGRLPQSLIDAVMFKPQLKVFEDAIMNRYSCSEDIEKIFT